MGFKDDIIVRFAGDATKLKKTVDGVKGQIGGLGKTVAALGSKLATVFGLGGGIAGASALSFVTNLADELDHLGKTASSLGVTVERFKELEFAVGQNSQLDFTGLTAQLQKLTKNIGNAVRGAPAMIAIFDQLGLAMADLQQLSPDEAYLRVIDALGQMPNAYDRAKVAQALFEDSWRQTILLSNTGAEKLREYMGEMKKIGTPTTEATEAAAAFNDQMDILGRNMEAIKYAYGPSLIEFFNVFVAGSTGVTGVVNDTDAAIKKLNKDLGRLNGDDESLLSRAYRLITPDHVIARKIEETEARISELENLKKKAVAVAATPWPTPSWQKDEKKVSPADDAKQKAAQATTKSRRVESEAQISETKAQVQAEGAYWIAERDLLASIQEDDVAAVEDARERMRQSIGDMSMSGAKDFRVNYYEQRIADEGGAEPFGQGLEVKITPVFAWPTVPDMQKMFNEGMLDMRIELPVQPILLDAPGAETIDRAGKQEGHDES